MNLLAIIINVTLANVNVITVSATLFSISLYFAFIRYKYLVGVLLFAFGMIYFIYSNGVLSWIYGLGGDSFLEAKDFDVAEMHFWMSALMSYIPQMQMPINKTLLLVVIETLCLSVLLFIAVWRWPVIMYGLTVLSIVGFIGAIHLGYTGFVYGREYVEGLRNQFNLNPYGYNSTGDVDLFVYIGESTASLNMSLYGYPFPTTPRLDKLLNDDIGFVRFDRVRSTHTHTSPSLLRALAVTSSSPSGRFFQWGIGGVLKQAGLTAKLYSVQPLGGSFAAFSRFIFDGMNFDHPVDERYSGNYKEVKIKDHQLLENALQETGVVFFHSYAGHGRYIEYIEPELSMAINRPSIEYRGMYGNISSEAIGSDLSRNIDDYDRAIGYIDKNVSRAIENIKLRKKPAVLIYFSDHGEAVYARRSHDSSNYIDEMTTVPMIMYFNEAYQEKYSEVFLSYRQASLVKETKLLDQVGPTILDVLRISSSYPIDVPVLAVSTKHPRYYILERETVSGSSKIELNYNESTGFSKAQFFGGTPDPTYISIINEKFGGENIICYHRTNSYAKALRAAAVTNCLEFDLVIEGLDMNIYHPPTTATGFRIEHIFDIAQTRKNSLWIDSKNLDDPAACEQLATYLEFNHGRVGKIFVEFPEGAVDRLSDLRSCSSRIKVTGARTSYYLPMHLLFPCAENSTEYYVACDKLNEIVQKVISSGNFTDLSFDFFGYQVVKKIKGAEKLKWNTWTIKAKDFHGFPRRDFDFVIMDASADPNAY